MNSVHPHHGRWAILLALGFVLVGASCTTSKQSSVGNPLNSRAWWRGDGVEGKPKIVINLSTQRVQYYKGGKLVGVSPISSGRENHGTMTGTYHIMEKDLNHRSSLFGAYADKEGNLVQEDVDTRTDAPPSGTKFIGASMRYFMRIVGGIGMHEGYLPGYPASHGCIRLPTKMAAIFYQATPEGTPVEIIGAGSLAANEAEIPIGVENIEEPPAPKVETRAAAKTKVDPAAQVAATKVPEQQLTVRRAIVEAPKSTGIGSMFNWFRKPPPGTTFYLRR